MNRILAVILNRNESDLLKRCVSSLIQQEDCGCDILMVDNASKAEYRGIIEDAFPGVAVVYNDTNLGVAGGRNVGIRYALDHNYRFVLLFDNDAIADKRMLQNLIAAADRHPISGILGPKILDAGRPSIIWRAGCTSWKWTYLHSGYTVFKRISRRTCTPLPGFLDTIRGENQPDRGQYDNEEEVDFQIGCAQLIRTAVFRDVGELDEEFSPYGSEDIDFCVRTKRFGWQIRYVPAARCWHRVDSGFQDEYQRAYCNTRHILLLARKHLHPLYFWMLFLPDFLCLTLPLMLLDCILKKKKARRAAITDALLWHLTDIRTRGLFLGGR